MKNKNIQRNFWSKLNEFVVEVFTTLSLEAGGKSIDPDSITQFPFESWANESQQNETNKINNKNIF